MKRGTYLDDYLKPLDNNPIQAYLTDRLQVADVIDWCVKQLTGQCSIIQTTFSISEEFLRRLYFLRKRLDGETTIRSITILLDHKATMKTVRLWQFMVNTVEQTYLCNNHSKVILIENQLGKRVSIITSQNLTRGNRTESSVVTTDSGVYARLRADLQDTMDHHSISLTNFYKQCQNQSILQPPNK